MVCFAAGGRFNSTRSITLDLYWLTDSPVTKDAYVFFCPPQSYLFDEAKLRGYIGAGFCPGGYGFMMKRVLASSKDHIEVSGEGVRVNGRLLNLTKALKADAAGRKIPRRVLDYYTLADSELLLMSDVNVKSFDSRYFGPIDLSQIKGVIRPIITF